MFGAFVSPAPADSRADAEAAYRGYIARFWFGPADSGHFGVINANDLTHSADSEKKETPAEPGWLWQDAQAWNVLWTYWKTARSGDPLKSDARQRLDAEWRWVEAKWPRMTCGAAPETSAQAMDDTTWAASGLIQLYDALGDRAALQDAADLLACGYRRWHTLETGGGLLYCDASDSVGCPSPLNSYKVSFNGQFGLAMLECAQRGCSTSSMTTPDMAADGKSIIDWGNAVLRRSASVCPQADALYWMDAFQSGPTTMIGENGCARPDVINPAGSITQLSNNLSFAAANAKLSASFGGPYVGYARETAASILAKEVDPYGVLVNDRDERTALYGLYPFLTYAYPLLAAPQQAKWRKVLIATAHSIVTQGAQPSGAYRPDWDPAWNHAWRSISPDQLEVAAQQAVAVICAQAGRL